MENEHINWFMNYIEPIDDAVRLNQSRVKVIALVF